MSANDIAHEESGSAVDQFAADAARLFAPVSCRFGAVR
jgi:hypothetical protein